MDIFTNELLVGGLVVSGRIKDGKFTLYDLNPERILKPPLRHLDFTKGQLDLMIAELKAVREKL